MFQNRRKQNPLLRFGIFGVFILVNLVRTGLNARIFILIGAFALIVGGPVLWKMWKSNSVKSNPVGGQFSNGYPTQTCMPLRNQQQNLPQNPMGGPFGNPQQDGPQNPIR